MGEWDPATATSQAHDPASTPRGGRASDELLLRAVQNNEADALDSYIRQGLHLDLEKRGKSLLLFAINKGKSDAALKLIAGGCNIDMQDSVGRTSLMHALTLGMNGVVEKLIEKGTRLSLADQFNKNAIDYARVCDNSKGRSLVYKHLNAKELQGELFNAITDENTEAMRNLVEQVGVDFLSARNARGQSPLEAAEESNNFDMAEYLAAKIATCGADAAEAVHSGTRDELKAMKKIAITPKSQF